MKTFWQFVETRGFAVIDLKHNNVPPELKPFNNQIVRLNTTTNTPNAHGVITLAGKGNTKALQVPAEHLRALTPQEREHAQWLLHSNSLRNNYVHPEKPKEVNQVYFDHPVIHDALEALKNCRQCQGIVKELRLDSPLDVWLMAADTLEEMGYDTRALRQYLQAQKTRNLNAHT